MNIKEFMSVRAQDDDKFDSVILEPTQEELEQFYNLIRVFPHLSSLDYIPDQFMQQISDFFGYNYLETEDPDVQREILKRIITVYHNKGLVSELHKIANRGYHDNFLISDLTYYNEKIEDGYSSITYPRDTMFQYDYSKWDSGDRWPDDKEYRDGVVEIGISVPTDPTERLLKLIDDNLAAGLKYYISILRDIYGTDFYVDMRYKTLDDTYDQWIYQEVFWPDVYVNNKDTYIHDQTRLDESKFDGHLVISKDTWEERKPHAAIHRIFYPNDTGYSVAEVWDEPFIQNWDRFCGIIDGDK